jgi:chemotaxis-related protein WspD
MPEISSIRDCWNKIGVWGDAECPELANYVHCRNCPVYSTAAVTMLNRGTPVGYIEEWTARLSQERKVRHQDTHSVVLFRLGSEWLALSTKVFKEVAKLKPIHRLPHRKPLVLGIVNIRGELLVCVSLEQALGLKSGPSTEYEKGRRTPQRLLVIHDEGVRLVFPVDEVGGVRTYRPAELLRVPSTLAGAASNHTAGMLVLENRSIGRLDEQLLFYTLNKGLS